MSEDSNKRDTIISAETVVAPMGWDDERAAGLTLPPAEAWAAGDARYEHKRLIGEGGMGAVALHRDRHVGRQVAMKTIRDELAADPGSQMRFVREARLQGQLEHPAVVPVYDIGKHADGILYFTMKKVQGVTLAEVLDRLASGHAGTQERFTERKLLTAFSSVCLAVDFAHRRGVVHRDLKPANIMLGDYGEVYVLDWGVAKVVDDDSDAAAAPDSALDVEATKTRPGLVVGTPGYMAPEQVDPDGVISPATDVYALGAILFELLTLTPLHDVKSFQSYIEEVQKGVEARPSERAPHLEVQPELDDLCEQAIRLDPAKRFASVRELHEALEGYLEGQRDSERRRRLATEHAERAYELAVHAMEDGTAIEERRQAMQAVGRALALDPDSDRAMETLVTLLNAPPTVMPPEVSIELDRAADRANRKTAWFGAWVYGFVLLATPILYVFGVRDDRVMLPFLILAALASGLSWVSSRTKRSDPRIVTAVMLVSSLMFAFLGLLAGPLMLVPPAVVANSAAFCIYTSGWSRALTVFSGAAAIAVPFAAERFGWLQPSYRMVDEGILILPQTVDLTPAVPWFICIASIIAVVASSLVVSQVRDALAKAERQLYLYAWHLREFVPEAARPPTDPTASRRAS